MYELNLINKQAMLYSVVQPVKAILALSTSQHAMLPCVCACLLHWRFMGKVTTG